MKTKTIITLSLLFIIAITKAQITWPAGLPDPNSFSNFDGSHDNFGQNHLFYPNTVEVRNNDKDHSDAGSAVKFYTMYTPQKIYLLDNNNVSFCSHKRDSASTDSVQRIDVEWQRSKNTAFLARVDTQTFGRLFYFDTYSAPTGGRTVSGGAAIVSQNIYNNIDMVYTSNNSGIVIYFIVYPGGNYKDIFLHFNGSNSNSIVGNNLVAKGNWSNVTFQKPQMYQYTISGSTVTPVNVCNASWINTGADQYQIDNATPSWNPSLPLIIQIKQSNATSYNTPGLCWSTYFGGWQEEFMTKTHTDASNNFYVAGMSSSDNHTFPQGQGLSQINPMGYDGAITQFNSVGQIRWSAFVGGSGNEYIRDFDFYNGSVYCVGKTSSNDTAMTPYPCVPKTGATNDNTWGGGTGQFDGFIFEFHLNTSVNPQNFVPDWSRYFGGDGWDDLYGCKIDGSGNLYIVGASSSDDMTPQTAVSGGWSQNFNAAQLNPSTPISTDGIIAKFNSAGSQQWFTFFGADAISGSNAYNHAADYLYGIALAGNNVYACGKTGGTNLPGAVNNKFVAGQFDGMLVNFSTNGILNASKYTDGNISNYAVKELWGDVYTVGEANSSMSTTNSGVWYYNSTAPGGNTDACFSVHTSDLSATTTHNTFFGGSDEDGAYDIQFSTNNLMVIGGGTRSSNFPVTTLGSMYHVSFAGGINDNFIAAFQKYNSNILWSSCLGTNYNESQVIPPFINSGLNMANTTISFDSQNTLRLLGTTTSNYNFPPDDGGGIPFFKLSNATPGNDATITCFDMSDLGTVTGIKDFPNTQFSFGIYPNPANKNLSITNTVIANDDLRYAIYDASGKKLQTGNLKSSDTKNVDISGLPQGIYIINVSNGKATYSNKFIKVAE